MYDKKISYVQDKNSDSTRKFVQNNFPATTKKLHNHTTVLYTKYVCNTKNYFPPEHNTTTVWNSKYIVVCTTKTYFPPEQNTDTTAQLKKRFL